MTREIWIVRALGWALVAAAAWAVGVGALREGGVIPDVVPFALVAGVGFDAVGRALARLARSGVRPDSDGRGPDW